MNIRVLSILMWKHGVVRVRTFIHTAVDCVLPLIFFILLFASKDNLRPPTKSPQHRDPVANTAIIRLEGEFIPPPYWIMYYPETMLTNLLMGEVGAKLNLQQLNSTSERAYFPLSDLSQLPDVAAKMQITEAVIIFQDMTGEMWPNRLNYTIRMKVDFKTGTYQSLNDAPGPYRMFGFKYTTFMRIQWAVDTSYIKLVTGDEVPQALSLQEFPYYYKRLDESSVRICKFLIPVCWLSLLLTFLSLMVRRLHERASGIQELLKTLGVSPKILGLSHFLNVLPCALIFSIGGTILLKATSQPLIQHSSGFLIFLMLLLYFNTVISLSFACSFVPTGTQYAASLSEMAYILLWMPTRVSKDSRIRLLGGLMLHKPMYWFWTELGALEMYDEGLSISNMAKTHAANNCSVLLCYIYMLLQAAIGYFMTWYLSNITPDQFGQALPWNFPFKRKPKSNEKEKLDKKLSEDYETFEYGTDRKVTYEPRRVSQGFCRQSDDSTWCYSSDTDDREPKSDEKENFDKELSEDYETSEYATDKTVTYEPRRVSQRFCRLSDDSNWCYSSDTDDRKSKSNEKENFDKELSEDYETSEYGTDRTVTYEPKRVPQGFCRQSDDSNWCYSSDTDDASYWTKDEVKPHATSDEEDPMTADSQFFEPPPADAVPGIKVANVSKMYPQHRVLKNVSLEVYKGEITVLLGHNGAGKTTLMSIITGMISATEGKVFIHGKDTVTQQNEVRKHLGLCPQKNLFIDDLTVREHIMFFTLLKQGTYAEARISASRIAERLTLSDNLNSLPSQLSGGMRRRVQIACALTGGADVLVLDEPTSGLDVETRRELWDLLLSLRGERTVLLTTHFMEEADALGDRVAALQRGVLRCFATTMYLKKAVGSGYRLVLTTFRTPREHDITKVVTSKVPGASVKEQTNNSISYSLPAAQTGKFPKLFSALEANRPKLGIDSIGVQVSSLEEVFLKLCSDIVPTVFEDEVDHVGELEVTPEKITGFHLYRRQLYVLFKRHVKYIFLRKWFFLIMNIFLPILMIAYMTYLMNGTDEEEELVTRAMNLDLYGDQADRRVMYHVIGPVVRLTDVATVWKRYPKVAFQDVDDVATAVLRTGQKDILEYNKYLGGVEINETDAKILYTTVVRHAAPVALNLLSNMLAVQHMPWADGRTITTMNDPVNRELDLPKSTSPPKNASMAFVWGLFIAFLILAANAKNVSLPCKDRLTNARHIHVMSGCPPELHWLGTVGFHAALTALTLVLPILLAVLVFEQNETTNQPAMLAILMPILVLGSLSFSVYTYLVSFIFGDRGISAVLVASIIIFAVFTPLMKKALEVSQEDSGMLYQLILFCNYIAPPYTMVEAILKCLDVARLNAKCKFVRPRCPGIYSEPGLDATKCCAGKNPRCYLCWDDFTPAKNIVILLVQILVMMTMLFLTERGFFDGVLEKVMNMRYLPENMVEQDKMVTVEKEYVRKAITLSPKQIPDAMLVHDLHKNYRPFFKKSVNAVRGISFSVKKGECFGLLGVNGSGKTSIFKMLTVEEPATKGNIFGNGYHLKRGNSQYLRTLGYCPQFFGLDTFMTGEENLELILTLRGFDNQRLEEEVRNWIHIVVPDFLFQPLVVKPSQSEDQLQVLLASHERIQPKELRTVAEGPEYLRTLGYCPQFFGLDTFMTGEENLELILTLRGFDNQRLEEEVRNWIHIVGLEKYAQLPVEDYSGGCLRRLGTAAALCSGAELALLDEPSAGVDVAARRRLWFALHKVLKQRRAIIITSHRMEEMEALCARIAILASGRFRVLGTAAELRAAHQHGHTVVFKLARKKQASADEVAAAETEILLLKTKLESTFNCTLKDEHKTMLQYHINQTMPYSKLFTALESLRTKFSYLIEDYSVTETTLEEVFLSFVKKEHTEAQDV